jgi:hypothetical protein
MSFTKQLARLQKTRDAMGMTAQAKAKRLLGLPYAPTTAMPPRHDRNFTTCMVCGASKTPDQQFCSRECCAEYKVTGAKYSPLTGKEL